MAAAFQIDREASCISISAPRTRNSESEELGDDVIARLNPETREVENLEVLFFSTRLFRQGPV